MSKAAFFGRKNYLDLLKKRVIGLKDNYRQNIALIADELTGKTSLIFKFMENFHDNRIIVIYMDTRPEPLASFARRFIGILLYNFLSNSGIPLEEDLDFLIRKSARYIPDTVEKIKSVLAHIAKRKTIGVFSELISLCEALHAETGKSSVVVFDEFQNLEALGVKGIYREWARLLISKKNTMYIITSSAKSRAKEVLAKDLALLFGNFEVINLEPFDVMTSCDFLRSRLAGMNIASSLRDFIVHFTGGFPMYLDVVTQAMLHNPDLPLSCVLEDMLFSPSGVLNQRFSNYIKRFSAASVAGEYTDILYLIASGRNKVRDISQLLKRRREDIVAKVNFLVESDAISKSGDFLKINDRVFGFWLKFVYQERLKSLTFDAGSQKARLRDQVEGMIQEFMLSSQKPLMERVNELFRLFEDEILQVEKKKIRLNHFREIKPLEFKSRVLKNGLIGRSSESLWVVAVKAGHVSEDDILELSRECRKYRHKLQRKIIVTLRDIDTNARLRALEEKVWAWDINNLNQILDLYSRPRVIA